MEYYSRLSSGASSNTSSGVPHPLSPGSFPVYRGKNRWIYPIYTTAQLDPAPVDRRRAIIVEGKTPGSRYWLP